ncbi:MAG: enoyl-CoA hydratase/isomerase family protein [Hyphomicrobiaceae bacterium]
MHEPVLTRIEERIGVVELARPDKFNCLSMRAWELIDDARTAYEADGQVRAIMIRAQGEHFCTGADLDEVKAIRSDRERTKAFIERGHRALLALEASPLPVIVAVQGLCLAGGLELMLAADIAFAAKGARFGDQHAQYGLVPGWGGSQRLPRLLGTRRALDIMFSAKWLSADEALAIGLVNYVTDDDQLHPEALAYATKLSERSRQGLAEMKRLTRQGVDRRIDEGLALEADAAVDHILGRDTTEGLAAFEARRKPNFD